MFERTLDHQRDRKQAPQQFPSTHQTPVYIFPKMNGGMLITLPEAKLIQGVRNGVTSNKQNAIKITKNIIPVEWLGELDLSKDSSVTDYGYVVEPVSEMRDKINTAYNLSDNLIADNDLPIELHHYRDLLEHVRNIPERQNEAALLRAFGGFILRQSR